ncbi:glycine cleavage system aminomethyltransferase GcvT [Pusillimonas sp. NJUB218]|uniref:glycine cleavage system aminomethyltransferase GcvT n=1 Tax=Pusillimonas sp. NJUB218 TaxID=2023230 RepID=UPI000F4BEB84|nr:glycine cleavage system aminomethyltransferase GcvT [Pusillimonas sp. NJUB218]ROT46788.1 glycine cleavage system protein T [Pusillimonas sp. NJUB218]
MTNVLKQTALYNAHLSAGARMVDFAGWSMPLTYGSQLEEHHAVRRACGMFDVSHMRAVDIQGDGSLPFFRRLLANDAARVQRPGQAMYSCMLNPEGGVIDDLIVYRHAEGSWRTVLNAATADADLDWMHRVAHEEHFNVQVIPRSDLSMLALQGPDARSMLHQAWPQWADVLSAVPSFGSTVLPDDVLVARTGYTGEDGYEVTGPSVMIVQLWATLLDAGVKPCGLGARDTLRLEAALNLYGQDMDESINPYECGLGWTVSLLDPDREFVGRDALDIAPRDRVRVGLELLERGVMRAGMAVQTPLGDGEITSGTMSPTLGHSIALARVPAGVSVGQAVNVEMRDKWLSARVVQLPFVRLRA